MRRLKKREKEKWKNEKNEKWKNEKMRKWKNEKMKKMKKWKKKKLKKKIEKKLKFFFYFFFFFLIFKNFFFLNIWKKTRNEIAGFIPCIRIHNLQIILQNTAIIAIFTNSQKYFKLNHDNMKKVMQNLKFVIMDKSHHCA